MPLFPESTVPAGWVPEPSAVTVVVDIMAELYPSPSRREIPDEHRIECVHLTCFTSSYSFLANVLRYSGIRLHRAETLEEADFLLMVTGSTVLLSDLRFLDGSWQDALIMASEVHPLVASLLIAEPADWPFLAEAYERGACGVLEKTINYAETVHLIRTVHQAVRDRMMVLGEESAVRRVGLAAGREER